MKKIIYLLVIATVFYAGDVMAFEDAFPVSPVPCSNENITPIIVSNNNPCPGGVYCEHYRCGEAFCCPWGYFYSNPCTCMCYKTSYDAGRDCNTYFRCN